MGDHFTSSGTSDHQVHLTHSKILSWLHWLHKGILAKILLATSGLPQAHCLTLNTLCFLLSLSVSVGWRQFSFSNVKGLFQHLGFHFCGWEADCSFKVNLFLSPLGYFEDICLNLWIWTMLQWCIKVGISLSCYALQNLHNCAFIF